MPIILKEILICLQELFEGFYFCQAQREDFFNRAKPYKGNKTIHRCDECCNECDFFTKFS